VTASVLLITYNHRPFIRQAVESVLAQETDFEWELLISEDCSTDGTREIVQEYAERHPGRVRLLLSARNQNDNEVISRGLRAARGEYVALIDGDDYWLSTRKLKKQVDRLQADPACALCFHDVFVVDEQGTRLRRRFGAGRPPPARLPEIVTAYGVPPVSVVLRRAAVRDLPRTYDALRYGDSPLYAWALERGTAAYLDEPLAAYRVHAGGVWSGLDPIIQLESLLSFYDELDEWLGRRHRQALADGKRRTAAELAGLYELAGDLPGARAYLAYALTSRPLWAGLADRRILRLLLLLHIDLARKVALVKRGRRARVSRATS
jgi:glycosyltransferase involved in cell wall biosynthesis